MTPEQPWTGRAAWAGRIPPADRERALDLLKLPDVDRRAEWWLTEFEDDWPYRAAPADVYFSRAADQSAIERPPIVQYATAEPFGGAEAAPYALAVAVFGVFPRLRRSIGRRSLFTGDRPGRPLAATVYFQSPLLHGLRSGIGAEITVASCPAR